MASKRVGCQDRLNISTDSPLPRDNRKRQALSVTPGSLRSNRSRVVIPCKRIADFPSPLSIKRPRNVGVTPNGNGNNSISLTPRHLMGLKLNIEPLCDEHYSFSFSPAFSRVSRAPRQSENCNVSFQSPMKGYRFFRNYVSKNPIENIRPSAILNPNKAVLVIDNNGKILTSNEMTFILFGDLLDNATIFDFIPSNSERKTIRRNLQKSNEEVGSIIDVSKCSVDSSFQDASLPLTFEEDLVEDIGKVVFCGQVITIDAHDIGRLEVSLWMQRVPTDHGEAARWVMILEPIKISQSLITVTSDGLLLKYDDTFKKFFSFDTDANMEIVNIFDHISSLKLPTKENRSKKLRQKCSGHTLDGVNFPLSLSVKIFDDCSENLDENSAVFCIKLKMFCHIGGLVVLDANASIVDYNRSFMRLLFGYSANELKNCDITELLPSFNQTSPNNLTEEFFACCDKEDELENTQTINMNNSSIPYIDESLKENSLLKEPVEMNRLDNKKSQMSLLNSEGSSVSTPNKALIITDSQFTLSSTNLTAANTTNQKSASSNLISLSQSTMNVASDAYVEESESSNQHSSLIMRDITNTFKMLNMSQQISLDETADVSRMPINLDMITSTPAMNKYRSPPQIQEGSYIGIAKHKDGSEINVLYQVRQVVAEGKLQFCMWILWEPDACEESLAETSRLELEDCQTSNIEDNEIEHSNTTHGKSFDCQKTSAYESPNSCSKSSKSSKSQLRYNKGSSPGLNSSVASFSGESLATESSISTFDESTSFCKSPGRKSQLLCLSNSVCVDSEDGTNSGTCTEGSSEDEYSFSHDVKIKEPVKKRSLSDSVIIRMKRRFSKDLNDSICEVPDEVLGAGDFLNNYTIVRPMGKGAFGFVKMCYRHSDGLLVSTKFITKSLVYKDSWVNDSLGQKLPLEIILIMTLDHPNIVKAHEFFENDKYFQLVTEKWGAGIDLFEFIERNPAIDEPLASYIFRQIVCALTYLRSNNILHHDIKDENIIIDHKFHIKLIDFGSASYWYPNTSFSNFAGTVEYCSPEVIKGGSHSGLELEVWSLGITLYTLMFGENPFSSLSQVAKQELVLPITYSEDFCSLLYGMLDKNPVTRLTLKAVADHPWTIQQFDLSNYQFEDIVTCKVSELNPPRYYSEYNENEDSMSTTSSSFVYEDLQSLSIAGIKDRSLSSPLESLHFHNSFVKDPSDISTTSKSSFCTDDNQVDLNSSRTSTSHSTTSLRSTVTIDSSILIMSPKAKNSKRARMPSESSDSTNEISSLTCSGHSSKSDLTNSCSSNSSLNTSDKNFSYADTSNSSVSPVSSNNSSSLVRQRTISIASSTSDEDTLNINFYEMLTIDDKQEAHVISTFCGDSEHDVNLADSFNDNKTVKFKADNRKPVKSKKKVSKIGCDSSVPYELFDVSSNSGASIKGWETLPMLTNDSFSAPSPQTVGSMSENKNVPTFHLSNREQSNIREESPVNQLLDKEINHSAKLDT